MTWRERRDTEERAAHRDPEIRRMEREWLERLVAERINRTPAPIVVREVLSA